MDILVALEMSLRRCSSASLDEVLVYSKKSPDLLREFSPMHVTCKLFRNQRCEPVPTQTCRFGMLNYAFFVTLPDSMHFSPAYKNAVLNSALTVNART